MKKYLGDAILRGNLDIQSDKPLDSRLIVQSSNDLYDLDPTYAYLGMPVVSIEDRKIYILIDKSKIDTSEGWASISSGKDYVILEEEQYENLSQKDNNILYFILEPTEGWVFPITLIEPEL